MVFGTIDAFWWTGAIWLVSLASGKWIIAVSLRVTMESWQLVNWNFAGDHNIMMFYLVFILLIMCLVIKWCYRFGCCYHWARGQQKILGENGWFFTFRACLTKSPSSDNVDEFSALIVEWWRFLTTIRKGSWQRG